MKNHKEKKIWDIAVRVFHWSLVALVFIAFLSGEEGESLHIKAGYAILVIVLMRIVWGFVGTKHARFSDFVKGPKKVFAYLRGLIAGRPPHYFGHNPAGGLMIVFILITLLCVAYTGIKTGQGEGDGEEHASIERASTELASTELASTELASTELASTELASTELASTELASTELASIERGDGGGFSIVSVAHADDDYFKRGHDDDDKKHTGGFIPASAIMGQRSASAHAAHEQWEEAHEFFVGLLLALIALHVTAVLMTWFVYKENLIKSMITGRKAVGNLAP